MRDRTLRRRCDVVGGRRGRPPVIGLNSIEHHAHLPFRTRGCRRLIAANQRNYRRKQSGGFRSVDRPMNLAKQPDNRKDDNNHHHQRDVLPRVQSPKPPSAGRSTRCHVRSSTVVGSFVLDGRTRCGSFVVCGLSRHVTLAHALTLGPRFLSSVPGVCMTTTIGFIQQSPPDDGNDGDGATVGLSGERGVAPSSSRPRTVGLHRSRRLPNVLCLSTRA